MKALITGGNGFIGSFLIEQLLSLGLQIRCLVRKTSNLRWIQSLPIEYVHGDLTEMNALLQATQDVDYVFHLGGLTKARTETEYFRINTGGTANLLAACTQTAPALKRFVLVSSLAAAGPAHLNQPITEDQPPAPLTPYGKSKAEAEAITLSYQDRLPVTIIRPPAVYGPRDTEVLTIFKYVHWGIKPRLAGPPRFTSLVHVADLVTGIILAAQKDQAIGQRYFLANAKGFSWEEIYDVIQKALATRAWSITLPLGILKLAAVLSEFFSYFTHSATMTNRAKVLELKQLSWVCDISKAQRELGFQPSMPLAEGIQMTVDWYRAQGWL
ncbi:NAD-dependent epimerase/dehydratase family protein [candidate division KSB1 bacterium]|nr:NAD-dependent epimerase/dehydratase family protein [candidate division KSB1 bacterium]